jgi:hypothetical protein
MPGFVIGLDTIDKFVKLGNELAKLPAFLIPQYRAAAVSLYEICQKLLIANETLHDGSTISSILTLIDPIRFRILSNCARNIGNEDRA